jgi:hypothetical protein
MSKPVWGNGIRWEDPRRAVLTAYKLLLSFIVTCPINIAGITGLLLPEHFDMKY